MKISILGVGSVGLGVASSLIKAGAQVTLLARGKTLRALETEGIRITGVLGEHRISPRDFSAIDAANPNSSVSESDLVIVATKTYEVAPALETLLPALKTNSALPAFFLLQNGWGSADEARSILPAGTALFSASVMTGLERLAPAHVRINAHADAVQVGSLFGDSAEKIQSLFDLSKRGFISFAYEPVIEPKLLTKLIYNICLNPLGALLRCSYGDLLGSEPILRLMERIADEGIRVLAATRDFSCFAGGEDYVRGELVPKWSAKVAAHRSSMLQDIESGRPTEIAYLNGAIAAMGRKSGIETPHNDTIVGLIHGAESVGAKTPVKN